jgi:hypothetical protein
MGRNGIRLRDQAQAQRIVMFICVLRRAAMPVHGVQERVAPEARNGSGWRGGLDKRWSARCRCTDATSKICIQGAYSSMAFGAGPKSTQDQKCRIFVTV